MSGRGPEAAACVTPQAPAHAHRHRMSGRGPEAGLSMSFFVEGEGA
jgi:hypothetical protein